MLKHEQQCFIWFKTQGDITEFFKPNKTGAASFLNGFKSEQPYEFIDKVILKIKLRYKNQREIYQEHAANVSFVAI